ncbi:CD209 antigen-like protein C isoform X1 [Cheilinus undulatus]|uniref:CD209 antigen-like protein C isoform X1 n=1 Tax=Cheilinus undulatus TaxID=241271 RepID=UPI001BD56DED|nr:CD209 antigen-like protein C isoform X1 [Cheilinus undulatus]
MASLMEMEGIYVNIGSAADVRPPTIQTSPESSPRRFDRPVAVFLGLLNVILLAGIIGLSFHSHHVSAELSTIKANLTEQLEVKDQQLSSLNEQRDLLNVKFTNMRKELSQKKKTCPAGWKMFQGSCYFFSTLKKTWEESRKDCTDKDADLVIIRSFEEQEFLTNNRKDWTWIGLSDKENEGIWKWTDGSLLTQEFWFKGQPDNGEGHPKLGEEDCVHFRKTDKRWNDRGCNVPMHWICEK